jgi:hypothetical protein
MKQPRRSNSISVRSKSKSDLSNNMAKGVRLSYDNMSTLDMSTKRTETSKEKNTEWGTYVQAKQQSDGSVMFDKT